ADRRRLDAGAARAGHRLAARVRRLHRARGDHGGPGGRQVPAPARGGHVTSIEVPFSIAAALPTLSVIDVTNEVARAVSQASRRDGIAYVSPSSEPWVV